MSEVWITHPALTPDHDQKIPRASLGAKVRQGWVERADQSDPDSFTVPVDPRQVAPESPAPSGTPSKSFPAPRKES